MTEQYIEIKIKELEDRIKALEQEPCGDAIIRQTVKEQMIKYGFHAPDMTVTEFVEDLPPVNPQERIYCDRNICIRNEYSGIGCDECEVTKSQEAIADRKKKFKMDEEQEQIDFIQPKKIVGKLISTDLFDKMKDEFISRYPKNYAGGLQWDGTYCAFSLNEVLDIINKYKAESEDNR